MVRISGSYRTEDMGNGWTKYVVSSGSRCLVQLDGSDGWEFKNAWFDCTASGAQASVHSYESRSSLPEHFTIESIVFEGAFPSGQSGSRPLGFACTGEGTVRNVYMGDGVRSYPASGNYGDHTGAMWTAPQHTGHITIEGCYAEGWVDNAFYCSAPGDVGRGGTHTIENCMAINNQISGFRLGSNGDRLVNCYGRTQAADHRTLWVYGSGNHQSEVHVTSCHLDGPGSQAIVASRRNNPQLHLIDTQYSGMNQGDARVHNHGGNGNNPEYFVPDGCPTEPEDVLEIADGGTPDTEPDKYEEARERAIPGEFHAPDGYNELHLRGTADYRIEVDGEIMPFPPFEQFLTEGSTHGGDWVDLHVGTWTTWFYSGNLLTLDLAEHEGDLDVELFINGTQIPPTGWEEHLGDSGVGGDDDSDDTDDEPGMTLEECLEERARLEEKLEQKRLRVRAANSVREWLGR